MEMVCPTVSSKAKTVKFVIASPTNTLYVEGRAGRKKGGSTTPLELLELEGREVLAEMVGWGTVVEEELEGWEAEEELEGLEAEEKVAGMVELFGL